MTKIEIKSRIKIIRDNLKDPHFDKTRTPEAIKDANKAIQEYERQLKELKAN